MSGEISRKGKRLIFNFAAGAVQSTEIYGITEFSSIVLYVPAEFNTDTLTLKSSVSTDGGFDITAATGRNVLDADQALEFFPMNDLIIVTDTATSAAAQIIADVKS